MNTESNKTLQTETSAAKEVGFFLFITAIAIPVLTMIGIFGYGFFVWIYHIFAGPPGYM